MRNSRLVNTIAWPKHIVRIDGAILAQLMFEERIGVNAELTYDLERVSRDLLAEDQRATRNEFSPTFGQRFHGTRQKD